MEPPAFPRTGLHTTRAAPGSEANIIIPLPSGTPPFAYEWTRAGATLDGRFKSSVEPGGIRLTVSASQTGDSGVYTLQASNAAGKDSTRVSLEVSPEEMPTGDDPPTFLRRLQDLTVKVGTRTRFLVEIVSSTECKVTWYRNERRLLEAERIALVRDGNFCCADVATVSVDDSGRWTCTAENLGGRASCSAHLNVLVPKAYKRPEFVEELRAILTEQGTVSLECKVVGVPTPVLRWFKDSREIKAGDVFALTANADDPTSLGTYTCEAINCMGRAYSSSKVHVIGRSKEGSDKFTSGGMTPDPPPIFTKELEDQFVRICESLTLSCHIVVPPWPRSVIWYNKEGKIEPSTKYHVLEDGVGGYMVEVSKAEWADEGEWKCVATSTGGRVGISSCSVTMDVPKNYRKPRFMENLQAILTEEGLVSFECKVVGFPTPVLSWFKDGQELKPGDVYQLTGTNSLGSYCCVARNCMGQASSSAELTVEDIQNQLNEEEKLQLFSKNQAPKFLQGLKSVEVKIDEPFRFTIKVAIPPDPTVLWYRDDQPIDESPRCHLGTEDRGVFYLDIKNLELMDQTEWKCVAMNDFGHSVTSCFLKLIVPRHFKKPRFLENLQAILSDEGAVNLECKVIGVPQPVLKWYKDGDELKPGDIHRIISGQDGTCCLGTYTCEAQNCMGIAASSASLLGFEDTVKVKKKKAEEQTLQRNLSLSTIHEERTSQMYDTPIADVTLDDKGEISFSFDGKEVSVSLYETPDLTEEEALQIVEMYADQLSENITEHNVIELPPLRFVKETSTSGNLLMEALIIDVSPEYFASPEEDLRTEADIEDISIADENIHAQLSFEQEVVEDYIEKTMALISAEKADIPSKVPRRKSDSQKSGEDYFSLSKDLSLSEEKKDDDTQILSESISFASARSTGKPKSKPSQEDELGTQESSDITKTVLLRGERRSSSNMENKVKFNQENSNKQDSLKSSKDINLQTVDLPLDTLIMKTLNEDMQFISSLLFKIINDIQVMERDIILKSQLMSSAAIASKSLEIINSLITPLSEIQCITDTIRETINESTQINSTLFTKLPFSLKELQKSLIMVEKCIDVGSDKTLINNTCISFINNCEEDITDVITKIKRVTLADLSFIDKTIISEIQSLAEDILNIIQISRSTVATKLIHNQEVKKEELSVEIQHLNDTQKAIYDLKIPLHSLLSIVENALRENTVSSININSAEVILFNMSASIQDLQTALEHIEFLSVEESNSLLPKYNTNIIETVMGSVLKLRSSFENLSMEKKQTNDTDNIQNVLQVIKINLNEIATHIGNTENTIGGFDILHGDNKLEVLQKMAHILISLENSLPLVCTLTNVQSTLSTFHKNLTKALEHVIECNDSLKYLTFLRICDVVNRINVSIKSISSTKLLSLASIGNNFSIIEEILKNNNIDQDLNEDILKSIHQYFTDIENITTYIEDESIRIDSEHVRDIPADQYYKEYKADTVIHQIDQVLAVINDVPSEEVISNFTAVIPVLHNLCPVLEELKYNVASLKQTVQEKESQSSDISVSSLDRSFGKPLQDLHENITVLNQFLLESVREDISKDELIAVFAKPLHELFITLQTLQENIISQYESLSSKHASGRIATATQILQNCILLVQEQREIEPLEEMSTLEDISCIKTTADSMSSDHLILPLIETTTVEQATNFFETEDQRKEVANVFQLLHNDIMEIQKLDILDALKTLSEVQEYADFKFASETIGELQNKITGILSPLLMEPLSSVSDLDIANSNISIILDTLLKLKNYLSIIDITSIPTYENVLQIPSDKIHLIVKNISNLKIHLDQCLSAVDQSSCDVPELTKEIDYICKECEDIKDYIRNPMQKEIKTRLSLGSISVLENLIEHVLQAVEIISDKNGENINVVFETFYKEILRIQDDVVQYANQSGDFYAEDDQLMSKINRIANAKYTDMNDFIKSMDNITCDVQSFLFLEDLVKSKISVINDLEHYTHTSDLALMKEFFNNCKNSFFIMRSLLCQQPTRKKVIRVLHEYFRLQIKINDFLNQRSTLDLPPEVQLCLDNFFLQAEGNLDKIKTSMLKICSSMSTSLFKIPLEKIKDSIECLPKYLKLDTLLDLHGLIQNFLIVLNIAFPHLQNLEKAVINEIQSCVFIDAYVEDRLITESLDNFVTFLENEISITTKRKIFLTDIVECFQNHQDYKNALGTSKKIIILKCLSEFSDLLQKEILETENKTELLIEHNSLQTLLNKILEHLKPINQDIKKIHSDDLCRFVQSLEFKMTELYKQVNQDNLEFEKKQLQEEATSLVKEVIKEINSIQDNLYAVKNAKEINLSVVETYLKEILMILNKMLFFGRTCSEHKLCQSEGDSFLQHIEEYIEMTETIEEVSAVVNLQNLQDLKNIDMLESRACSKIAVNTLENQDNLSLADIHDQGLDETNDINTLDNNVQQNNIDIISCLQNALSTSVEVSKNDSNVEFTADNNEIKIKKLDNEKKLQHKANTTSESITIKAQHEVTGCENNVINKNDESFINIEAYITLDKTEPLSDDNNLHLSAETENNNKHINSLDLQPYTDNIDDDNNNLDLSAETESDNKHMNSPDLKPYTDNIDDDNNNLDLSAETENDNKHTNSPDLQQYTNNIAKILSPDLETNKHMSHNIVTTDSKMYIEDCEVQEFSTEIQQREANASVVIHQIENAIFSISNIYVEEIPSNLNNIYPVLESICPILEEIKLYIPSLQIEQSTESHTSDISNNSVEQTFCKPLRKLEENIIVLNQFILESVKDDVENERILGVFAKPLHELYCTYQTLQENVISQHESFSSLHDSINVAKITHILQNSVLLIEEQHIIEAADEISTLEDVSCIKTTAESIFSDVLPIAQEVQILSEEFKHELEDTLTYDDEREISCNDSSKIEMVDVLINKQTLTEDLIKVDEIESDQNQMPHVSENENRLHKHTSYLIEQKDITSDLIETELDYNNKELSLKNIADVEQDNSLREETECKAILSHIYAITSDVKKPINECITRVEEIRPEYDKHNVELITLGLDLGEINYSTKEVVEHVPKKIIEKDISTVDNVKLNEYVLQNDLNDLRTTHSIDSQDVKLIIEDTTQNLFGDQIGIISYSSPDNLEIIEPQSLNHEGIINKMEVLLSDLQDNIKYVAMNLTENTEIIQNILDEFQMQILKFKSVNTKQNTEVLNDLECSVRSVQLLVSENSPPHHVMEASETLQLLINSLKDELCTTTSDILKEENYHNLLEKCVEDTKSTLIVLNKVTDIKSTKIDIDKIISDLKSVKDLIKSIKQNFATDEETVIENGVEIIQRIDTIENQLFCIENELDTIQSIDQITRDTIVTAVHSVFINISNMRGTISSIQNHYIYENYGKPSENLLNAIKNINAFKKLDDINNWKQLSKHLRNVLNHFEDIKFYINLDKTARLPSDASLTKQILNDLKLLLSSIALTNLKELQVPSENEVHLAIRIIEEKLENIQTRSVLDVKEKIPIFKELSSQLIELTNKIKKYFENNIDTLSADHNTQFKETFSKEDQKILTGENCETKTFDVTLKQPNNVSSIEAINIIEKPQNLLNQLPNLNSEISKENNTPNCKKNIIDSVRPVIDRLIEEAVNKIMKSNISEIVLEKDLQRQKAMKYDNINQISSQHLISTPEGINNSSSHISKTNSNKENVEMVKKKINEIDLEQLSEEQNIIDKSQLLSISVINLKETQTSLSEQIEPINTILKTDDNDSELELRKNEDLDYQHESENISNLQHNHFDISGNEMKIENISVVTEYQLDPCIIESNVDTVSLINDISVNKIEGKEHIQENLKYENKNIESLTLSQENELKVNCKAELEASEDSTQISKTINDFNLNVIKNIVKEDNLNLDDSKIVTESLTQDYGPEKGCKLEIISGECSVQMSSIIEQKDNVQLTPDEIFKHSEEFSKTTKCIQDNQNDTTFVENSEDESPSHFNNHENDEFNNNNNKGTEFDNELQSPSIEFDKNHDNSTSTVPLLTEKEFKPEESLHNEYSSKSDKHSEKITHDTDILPNSNKNVDAKENEILTVKEAEKSNTIADIYMKNNDDILKETEMDEKDEYTQNQVRLLTSRNDTQETNESIINIVTQEILQKKDEKIFDEGVLKSNDQHCDKIKKDSKLVNYTLLSEKIKITNIQQPQVQVAIYSTEYRDSCFEEENQNSIGHDNNGQSNLCKNDEKAIISESSTNEQCSLNEVKSIPIIQSADIGSNGIKMNNELGNKTEDSPRETLKIEDSMINVNKSLNVDLENLNMNKNSSEHHESDRKNISGTNLKIEIKENFMDDKRKVIFEEMKISRLENVLHLEDEEHNKADDGSQTHVNKLQKDESNHEEISKNFKKEEILIEKNDQQLNMPEEFENKSENKIQKNIIDEQLVYTENKTISNYDVSNKNTTHSTSLLTTNMTNYDNTEISTETLLTNETNDNLKKAINVIQSDLTSSNDNKNEAKHVLQGGLNLSALNVTQYGDLQDQEEILLKSENQLDSKLDQFKLKNDYEQTQEVKVEVDSCEKINKAETISKSDVQYYYDISEQNRNVEKIKPADIDKSKENAPSKDVIKDAMSYEIQEPQVIIEYKSSDEIIKKVTEKNVNDSKYIAKLDKKLHQSEIKEPDEIIHVKDNNLLPVTDNENEIEKLSLNFVISRNTCIIKEKPQFVDPNVADPKMEFSRPPVYIPKPYDSDLLMMPEMHIRNSPSNVFYKAESLVRDHQIRSPTDTSNINLAEKYRQSEIKIKTKAMSESKSLYSDKRVSTVREFKRKPVFSTHLTNRTAVEGSRVKLTCSVLSSTAPIMKWFKNGVLLDDKQKYKIKFVDGLITMELLNALPSDSGDYSCTIENEHGFVTTSAQLKVYPSFEVSPIPPTFTRSIRDIYHRAENELVLECRIRGQPLPTITWLKDNMPISSGDRYEALYLADGLCRLTINSPTIEDNGSYTCRAESSMWSDQITHVVNFTGFGKNHIASRLSSVEKLRSLHDTRRPHFTNVLNDYKVVKGGTIGLQVEIGGAPTRVEWLRGESPIAEIDKNAQIFVDHGIYTLALSDVTEKHSGLYTCRAWSSYGNVDMNADITVIQPNEMEGKAPVIVSRPAKDILISVGEDVNISFRVQGEPRPKVIFMKGIRDITNSQRVCKMTSDDYVKFTLKRSVISDAGTYCILARNVYGCDRTFVTVVVRQRASSENLVSDWTYPNDDSTIFAPDRNYKTVPERIPGEPHAVDGGNNWVTLAWPKPDPHAVTPILAYRVDSWLLGKDGGARWIEMGITPRNTFDAFNLKQGEEYHFRVTPRNRYGWGEPVQTSSPIAVGIAGDRPEFVDILPGLLKVLVGETANLSCSLKGKPTPEIIWMKNGHEIEEDSRIKSAQRGNICSLTIQDVEIGDEGRYSCEATNVHGRASTYARMAVITDRQIWEADAKLKRERSADVTGDYPPQFTMRLRDRRVQATYPVRLTCQVIGSPAPSMTWFKDGQEIIFDSRKVKYKDEYFHTLEIAPTTLDDGGVYEALARNNSGAVSCRCCLVVDKGIRAYVAPEFCCGLEPLYRLNEGEELRVSAIVEAYPSVGVTWYRDGVRLRPSRRAIMTLDRDGQIELALASVTTRDAGVYTCTASNEVGQASTSGKVEIVTEKPSEDRQTMPTVICPNVPYSKEPMFIKKPRSTEALEGDTVIIECEVIGDPTPDVYWLRDFLKPDYYRDANHFKQMAAGPLYRFEIPHAKLDFTGAYSVVARNVHGEAKAIISLQIFAKDLRSNDETHNIRYGRVEVIPRFEKELTDLLCYDGDAIEFECRVSGNPEPDIRWFHYNQALPDCPDFESTYEAGTVRLKIKQVAAEDEGTYTCEASNNLGKATSKACLVVYPPGEPNTLSQRLQRPPALASSASTPRSTPRATPARSTSRTPGSRSGSVAHRLRTPTREIAPKFYTYPFNKVVEEGDSVVLQCAVGGLPTPWATWDKDGIIITPTSRISIKEKDEMLRILQIDEVTTDDVGLYRITLENDFGRAEASARLEVISHKGKFYARSTSVSPARIMYRRRTPSLTRQD